MKTEKKTQLKRQRDTRSKTQISKKNVTAVEEASRKSAVNVSDVVKALRKENILHRGGTKISLS